MMRIVKIAAAVSFYLIGAWCAYLDWIILVAMPMAMPHAPVLHSNPWQGLLGG